MSELSRLVESLEYYQSLERHFTDPTERDAFIIQSIDFCFFGERMLPKEYSNSFNIISDRKMVSELGNLIFDYFEKEVPDIVKSLKEEIKNATSSLVD